MLKIEICVLYLVIENNGCCICDIGVVALRVWDRARWECVLECYGEGGVVESFRSRARGFLGGIG